jgi:hypothetical protein
MRMRYLPVFMKARQIKRVGAVHAKVNVSIRFDFYAV